MTHTPGRGKEHMISSNWYRKNFNTMLLMQPNLFETHKAKHTKTKLKSNAA